MSGSNSEAVAAVLSGDSIVLRDIPKDGPPPERTLAFSNVVAPRMARRPTSPDAPDVKDEPFAWEAREFVRKLIIGKEVAFTVEYKPNAGNREYGCVYIGKNANAPNLTEMLVNEGLVEVRRTGINPNNVNQQQLIALEEVAKAGKAGKWAADTAGHVRSVTWTLENPRHFVDSRHNKPVNAVVEHVRDGSTVRVLTLPDFHYVTVMLSGIKSPMFRMEGEAEEFAEEAKFFVEARLLNRDVSVIFEGVSNQNLLGTVLHPKGGNIAEQLLKQGLARCVDWSMGVVTRGASALRNAERVARDQRLKIWKNWQPSSQSMANGEKSSFVAKVMEVVNGDALTLRLPDGSNKKFFLSSVRPPRPADDGEDPRQSVRQRSRPLYDVPYMFEAREFLRNKLIGRKVKVEVDYVQPAGQGYPEKTCASIFIGDVNVAEALVSKGLATVVRYRQDDDRRSAHYDLLLAAEERAKKKGVGLHSAREAPLHRVADVAGDAARAKQFLPSLRRLGRTKALVEFVASGSRMRLYIPHETCLLTFLLAGVECPRGARPGPGGVPLPAEPYGDEACALTRDLILQREVEIEVETLDKGGNFIGWLWIDNKNLSLLLVSEGLAAVHFSAERTAHFAAMEAAEKLAKDARKNIWKDYVEKEVEPTPAPQEEEAVERKVQLKSVIVTEVIAHEGAIGFYAQHVDRGPQLEELMNSLRKTLIASPPPVSFSCTSSYRVGALCSAKFVDGCWYRARIEQITDRGTATVFYLDYGNRAEVSDRDLAALPPAFVSFTPQAHLYSLAYVRLPPDPDAIAEARRAFAEDVLGKQLLLNVEYRVQSQEFAQLLLADGKSDVGLGLVGDGLLVVDVRREKRLRDVVGTYVTAQNGAKQQHLNIWRYGDITEDDAKEFGYPAAR